MPKVYSVVVTLIISIEMIYTHEERPTLVVMFYFVAVFRPRRLGD